MVSIDFKRTDDGRYLAYRQNGSRYAGHEVVAWARQAEALGAGEILLTSVAGDGAMAGYDLEITRQVAEAVSIPVIASGGAGTYEHMAEAILQGKAAAAAAASIFHFTQQTPLEAKHHLATRGIPVRIVQAG